MTPGRTASSSIDLRLPPATKPRTADRPSTRGVAIRSPRRAAPSHAWPSPGSRRLSSAASPGRPGRSARRMPTSRGRVAAMDARILLVEDDPSIREATTIGLRAAGFEVETADDGAAGLERWRRDQPDLVLLD